MLESPSSSLLLSPYISIKRHVNRLGTPIGVSTKPSGAKPFYTRAHHLCMWDVTAGDKLLYTPPRSHHHRRSTWELGSEYLVGSHDFQGSTRIFAFGRDLEWVGTTLTRVCLSGFGEKGIIKTVTRDEDGLSHRASMMTVVSTFSRPVLQSCWLLMTSSTCHLAPAELQVCTYCTGQAARRYERQSGRFCVICRPGGTCVQG